MSLEIINLMYSIDNPKRDEIISSIKERTSKVNKLKEVEYKELEYIILSNQVRTHHSFLSNLRALFREID